MCNYKKGSEILSADAERLRPDCVVLVEQYPASGEVVTNVASVGVLRGLGAQFWHPYVRVYNVSVWAAQEKPGPRDWYTEP